LLKQRAKSVNIQIFLTSFMVTVMSAQILKKWGNSPAVRIPASLMELANLSIDQAIEVRVENGRVIIEPAKPEYSLEAMLAAITPENRHGEVDFGVSKGTELL
jgi:antitoxin MazE